MYVYIYISIHTYILEQGRWLDLKQGDKSLWKSAPKKYADLEQNLNLKEVRQQPSHFVWRLPGAHHPAFWVPTAHLRFLVWRFKRLAFGPGRTDDFSEKSGKKGPWLMVLYGPRSDEKWSQIHIYKRVMVHEWWEMVPTSIWMSILIHWFINPVNRSRLMLTVDKDSPTREYGQYWRSIRIHLQRITLDRWWWIKIRDNFFGRFHRRHLWKLDGNLTVKGYFWTTFLYKIIFGWQKSLSHFWSRIWRCYFTLKFYGDTSTGRGSTKIWKKYHFWKQRFHRQNADFPPIFFLFLEEQIFKYKLHILSLLGFLSFATITKLSPGLFRATCLPFGGAPKIEFPALASIESAGFW